MGSSGNEASPCPRCGTSTSQGLLGGLCPRCVARVTLDYIATEGPAAVPGARVECLEPAGLRLGDYEMLEELGRGGMGVVYKARQLSLNRIVAVKMLLHGSFSSQEFVKRFQAEAEAVASLHHPNIVTIFEVGTLEGLHFFSMEYVDGPSLAELARNQPLPSARAARFAELIADAIHYAHVEGIIHRDLKPSNVILDGQDQPRVTDFGVAKRLAGDPEITTSGQILGAPAYMAPEQAAGKRHDVGVQSDVYALGALLYYLLAGRPPFTAPTLSGVLMQAQTEPPAPLTDLSLSPELESICLKCLEKEPSLRYGSAADLAEDLRRWQRGEPVMAAAPRRHLMPRITRRPLVVTATCLTVLAVTSAFFNWKRTHRPPGPTPVREADTAFSNASAAMEIRINPLPAQIEAEWRQGRDLPQQCEEAAAVALNGRLYVVGGRTGHGDTQQCMTAVQVYDAAADQWGMGADLPEPLAAVGLVAHEEFIYCFGGIREPFWWGHPVSSVYRFDVRRNAWKRLADMPIARSNFAAAAADDRICCAGGNIYWPDATSRVDIFEPLKEAWTRTAVMPTPRGSFTGGFWQNLLVLLPGIPGGKLPTEHNLVLFDVNQPTNSMRTLPWGLGTAPLFLCASESGILLLTQTNRASPPWHVCHLTLGSGELAVCQPPSRTVAMPTAVAYDPTRAVGFVLGCPAGERFTRTLEMVRLRPPPPIPPDRQVRPRADSPRSQTTP
jgi:hypothetical protein